MKAIHYIVENDGVYSVGSESSGRVIAKDEDLWWCTMWVIELNENPLKEGYLNSNQITC